MIRLIARIALIASGTLIVTIGTFLLVAYGEGYSYDLKRQALIRNGLVILDSTPGGAQVTLDNKTLNKKTPFRKTLKIGSYTFSLAKTDYRPWSKRLQLTSSEVALADYVVLVPNQPKVETLAAATSINQFVASSDHKHVTYAVPNGPDAGIWLLDTTTSNPKRLYTSTSTDTIGALTITDDGQHVLAHITGPNDRYLMLSPNSTELDVNTALSTTFSKLYMDPTNWRELYWNSPEGLRRISLSDKTISNPLLDRVASFTQLGDRIIAVQTNGPVGKLVSVDRNGKASIIDPALPLAASYTLAASTFHGPSVLAVTAVGDRNTHLYRDIASSNQDQRTLWGITGSDLKFSDNSRYLSIAGDTVQVYDWQEHYVQPLVAPISANGLTWYNDNYTLNNSNGKLNFQEFDGANSTDLALTSGLPATAGGSGQHDVILVSPAGKDGKQAIQRIKMRP